MLNQMFFSLIGNSPPIRPIPQQIPQYNTPQRQKATPNVSFSNKINGPPTQGLFDTLHQPDWNSNQPIQSPGATFTSPMHNSTFGHQENYLAQLDSPFAANSSFAHSQQQKFNQSQNFNQSMAQTTISNNDSLCYASPAGEMNTDNRFGEEPAEFWITVFGFPLSAASMVLTQFSNCGNLIGKLTITKPTLCTNFNYCFFII